MSDLDPLFPRHANSGPAPEVTPPNGRTCAHQFDDRIGGSCLICGIRPGFHDETPFPMRRLNAEERAAIEAFIIESGIRP